MVRHLALSRGRFKESSSVTPSLQELGIEKVNQGITTLHSKVDSELTEAKPKEPNNASEDP